MTQLPILSGIFTDANPDFRTMYPHNMVPVPRGTGISNGYLRPGEGFVEFSAGHGPDRGGYVWRGNLYRVQGTDLVRINADSSIDVIGDVGIGGYCIFDSSFDYLAVSSGGRLYLYNGSTLQQNTDPDLGTVNSFIWLDGYFVVADFETIATTELDDPFTVNPLKYGASEIDPDPIVRLLELRNELYVVNQFSIEVFDNVGGDGFPFQRIEGAQIQKGASGIAAATVFDDKIAFVGGGREESPAVYLAVNGSYQKISTPEIEEILLEYTQEEIASISMEQRNYLSHVWLYIHLPDQTVVYDIASTRVLERPIWFTLSGGITEKTRYPARDMVWAYDKWLTGDPVTGRIGEMVRDASTHFGEEVKWQFGTIITYNVGLGAIVHDLELVALTGEVSLGLDPQVTTEYSTDGVNWSQPMTVSAGTQGDRAQRIAWRRNGKMRDWRTQRFSGTSDAHISIARLEARFEGLAW